ncbi:MAG: hypothetical protein JWM14_2308 [Chitinophagaceae bacterium]|nr:hypothetical protein [Chitinophagaceae bacterium]
MSDTLNFSRLSLLLKNHLVEHKQKYLYYLAGMFFIGLIVVLLVLSFSNLYGHANIYTLKTKNFYATKWEGLQTALYLGGLGVFSIIFSSVSFVNFNNKGESIFYLIKPASQLEKWLTEVIVHVFLFFVAYTLIYYVINIPITLFVRASEYAGFMEEYKVWTVLERRENLFRASTIFHFSTLKEDLYMAYPICISIYFSVTAFFMYGAVLFNRFSFFKTLILGFLTFIVYTIYNTWLIRLLKSFLMPDDWNSYSYSNAYSRGDDYSFEAVLSPHWGDIILYSLLFVIPVVLLACSYFKLQEKEV